MLYVQIRAMDAKLRQVKVGIKILGGEGKVNRGSKYLRSRSESTVHGTDFENSGEGVVAADGGERPGPVRGRPDSARSSEMERRGGGGWLGGVVAAVTRGGARRGGMGRGGAGRG